MRLINYIIYVIGSTSELTCVQKKATLSYCFHLYIIMDFLIPIPLSQLPNLWRLFLFQSVRGDLLPADRTHDSGA